METKETMTIKEQRQRRNRINRMKTGIILTIAVWMIASLIAIVVLSVQVVRLDHKIDRLTAEQAGNIPAPDSQKQPQGTESNKTHDSSDGIVTGIDEPDNMAGKEDVHEVYLTFDGSPCANTNDILDVLKEYDIRATFFVVGDDSEEMKQVYKRIVDEGHTLGMHSYSNKYSTIYASTEAFEKDFSKLSDYLKDVTGTESLYYRFPGGSSNEISNVSMAEFVRVLNQKNIAYFDWNVSAGDTASDYTVDDIIENVTTGVARYKTSVVLLHDGDNKSTTVEALGPLIVALQNMDAKILPIDENTKVIQYIKADSVE